MEPEEYEKMYELEGTHWWFVSKRRLVDSFLKNVQIPKNSYILDIGCGTGANLKSFSKYGKSFGIDVSPLAIKYSSMRGCSNLVRANINNLPFKKNIFDIVNLLDILYHKMVDEDKKALDEIYRIIKQGGRIFITDSALEFLRSPHDMAVHGKRRYNKWSLQKIVLDAGFKIERLTYINFFLFPVVFIVRLLKRLFISERAESDLKPVHPILNHILLGIQEIERLVLRILNLPIGSSILCIARK